MSRRFVLFVFLALLAGSVHADDGATTHWAFQPVRRPTLPAVKLSSWPITALDVFILAKLEAAGLNPSPSADRRTLLRRVTLDLIGLPPTADEMETFVRDTSPDAYDRVIERLLASPHYGERWGRHWLDVARYADTKDGVLLYGDDRVRPYAYTYRDYVIRALNEDLPFDRFVQEQLAADHLTPTVEPWRLAALGFLTLGRQFDNNIHDVIDDRIDTVTRGFLGLTVACARCHDHKYDPVPTQDYYSLYGVFAASEMPLELPPIEPLDARPAYAEFEKQAGPLRREIQQFLQDQFTLLTEVSRRRIGDYLVHVATTEPDPLESAIYFLSLAPTDLRPPIVASWRRYLEQHAQPGHAVFGLWHELMTVPQADLPDQARAIIDRAAPVNPLVRDALAAASLQSRADVARAYGELLQRVYEDSQKSPPAPNDTARRQLLDLVIGTDSPAFFPQSRTWQYMSRPEKDAFNSKLQALDKMAVNSPHAPPRAMVLVDAEQILEPCVFIRGNPTRPGERVPRRFLQILAGEHRPPFPNGSGRLDLARAIADPANPLTARVLVNRVWMHHFGEPLVASPGDFGLRSSPPSHPELLDYLASVFVIEGRWSLKHLHRLIVSSATYRQSSFADAKAKAIDPENRWLGRMNRRRLDLETMRDGLLAVSGRLDTTQHGRPVDAAGDPLNRRRTVYGLVDRQSLPGVFRAFDFASPDTSCERRPKTVVPQQALFGLNSAFMMEQARALAARPEVAGEPSLPKRIAALYRLVFARQPDPAELERGLAFVATVSTSNLSPWEQYAQVLLLTNEWMFVD